MAKVSIEKGMLLMICNMCALERKLAEGEPKWCDSRGNGRRESAEIQTINTVEGMAVVCILDLYGALAGNPPDQVFTL